MPLPKLISQLTLFTRRNHIRYTIHIPFVILYSIVLYYCALTIGEPYDTRIAELRADGRLNETTVTAEEISAALEGTTVTLPNPYLPSLVPFVSLMCLLCSHVLIALMQVWYISVDATFNYSRTENYKKATHLMAVPQLHHGKPEIVTIVHPTREDLGDVNAERSYFMFQRHKFTFEPEENGNGYTVRQVKPSVRRPLQTLLQNTAGHKDTASYDAALALYGENVFAIRQPEFKELYAQQLIQPITVFQIFCTLLWMMDEYWQYSLFSGVMIFLFEAVTVFGRMKSMNMIRGMTTQDRQIYVRRCGEWSLTSTSKLVPGDVISLALSKESKEANVPCDCLLLKGIAVVNEASLTGESHPQLKEEVTSDADGEFEMHGLHKYNTLFGGTTLLQQKHYKDVIGDEKTEISPLINDLPMSATPDEGCLCLVLRTGFSSSQGKLVSMIENSTEEVRDDSFDSLFLVIFLLIFACIASGYVLSKGLENKERSNFELLLHCVMIITCVIPPSLPMQTAMAVNSAVLTLMKMNIFCTEPYRIPTAGKVDLCLFDKTGTITADQLAAVGLVQVRKPNDKQQEGKEGLARDLEPIGNASFETAIVLGTCHALMSLDGDGGRVTGDPLEEEALKAVQFTFDSTHNRCTPMQSIDRGAGKEKEPIPRSWVASHVNSKQAWTEILHRNHFASALQRMSVIARVNDGNGNSNFYSLVKGSPEKLSTLVQSVPAWYWPTHTALTRSGMRIIALAYKRLPSNYTVSQALLLTREEVESELTFAGFIAFRCLVRKDSREVLSQLMLSSHQAVMITGDAVLTACHVAGEVGLVSSARVLVLEKNEANLLVWKREGRPDVPFSAKDMAGLAEKFDLCVSGLTLTQAIEQSQEVFQYLHTIKIFARMVPELKELVIKRLKESGHCTLMCGDGANDVGALRQASVGVALLSGFGSMNVDKSLNKPVEKAGPTAEELKKIEAQRLAEEKQQAEIAAKKRTEEVERRKAQMMRRLEEETAARDQRGESCASLRALGSVMKREWQEGRAQMQENSARGLAGNVAMKQALEKYMNEMDTDTPCIKLGDASVAASFTSKVPSISSVLDIIRQGRCALVTRIQMYQILALNCLISAYSLSVLYLDGIKYGDQQMTASGILLTISFLTLSHAAPLKDLSKERPFLSIFQPALFFSLLGQIAIHTGVMWYATSLAKEALPDWRPQMGGKFEPNLLNSVVFLVSTTQSVSVFAVNYKGRPFMESMTDKPGLLYSLGACLVGVVMASTESLPVLNKVLQLVAFPSVPFGQTIMALLMFNVLSCFAWDALMMFLFGRDVLMATIRAINAEDIRKLAKMATLIYFAIYFFTPSEENYELLKEEMAKQNL